MADKAEKGDKRITLPEGRVINASLFEKDVYTAPGSDKEGKPQYKLEITFDEKDVTGEGNPVEDAILDAVEAKWGADAVNDWIDGKLEIKFPWIDGDKLARKREQKGKPGDAYKGKLVLRAHTSFNRDGRDAPGGIAVYGPDASELKVTQQGEIYPGCYGIVAVTFAGYENNEGEYAVTAYLVAFQKTRDGEKLMTPQDHSKLFKPVGRTASAAGGDAGSNRRRRAG